MGSKTKHTTTSFKDTSICSSAIADSAVTTGKINADAVTSAKISNATVTTSDLASSLDLSSKTVTLPNSSFTTQNYNIGLLGFKMAVNESLTVFNLVDGVVDEFNDESGTDEAEGTNDLYNTTDDYYINSTQPDGQSLCFSAGFTMTTVTEPDTSTAGTNPAQGSATMATFTVPCGVSSVNVQVFGAGGGGSPADTYYPGNPTTRPGGGGGYVTGTLGVSGGQTLYISAGETGSAGPQPGSYNGGGAEGGSNSGHATGEGGGGGGLSGVFNADIFALSNPQFSAPQAYIVAGSGGGAGSCYNGGAAGGLTGDATNNTEQTSASSAGGGGGDQEQGGQGGLGNPGDYGAAPGNLFNGGIAGNPTPSAGLGGGGSGYYGGGGGGYRIPGENLSGGGGGGSSFFGHPQITCGSTEEGSGCESGGVAIPNYVASTGEGIPQAPGEDGYALITAALPATATSTTIVSSTFSATSVPTSSRIVIFEENIDTPTLNTDIIASVSRDGTNFTNATLSDSGYVTGSSGQRILTGQADISGQPSGQSMRWKLALANNQVKIHGVSLSWA